MNAASLLLLVRLATVSGDVAAVEVGFLDGLAVGDEGVVFYQLIISGEEKRVEIGSAEVVRVEPSTSELRLATTRPAKSDFLVEFTVPADRRLSSRRIMAWITPNERATLSETLTQWAADGSTQQPELARYLAERLAENASASAPQEISQAEAPEEPPKPPTPPPIASVQVERPAPFLSESDAKRKIRQLLFRWTRAWSRKDFESYIALYSLGFTPKKGGSRTAWAATRRQRLARPGEIEIRLSAVEIELSPPSRAKVTFGQDYTSASYRDSVVKVLELRREDGSWRIWRERVKAR